MAQGVNQLEQSVLAQSMQDLALVGAMGAGGAVIGLSTLSFAHRPGEHLGNILTGAALGVIAGAGWVAYQQTTVSRHRYQKMAGRQLAQAQPPWTPAPLTPKTSPLISLPLWSWRF